MEKITGKIIEVHDDYSIVLGGYNRNPIKATETAKKYISKEDVGKEAEVTIEGDKITFIKIFLLGNVKTSNDILIETITKLGWNLGISALTSKMQLLSDLETLENGSGRTPIQKKIHTFLLKDLEKILKAIDKIQEEQEKNG